MTSRLVFSAGRVTKVYEGTLALTILLVNMKSDLRNNNHYLSGSENRV